MKDTNRYQWWQIRCDVAGLSIDIVEALSVDLVNDIEQSGTAQEKEAELVAYLYCNYETCTDRLATLQKTYDFTAEIESLDEKNWVAESQESWSNVVVGKFTIVPCLEPDSNAPPPPGEIRIHPGTGFGTGHHATTSMLLQFLQSQVFQENRPGQVLDVGTGSGILAIAAQQLFATNVQAFDTDPMAIENAIVNVRLNNCSDAVLLDIGTIDFYEDTYDLVIANLYAELLIELSEDIIERTKDTGRILLSGILLTLWPQVEKQFIAAGCKLEQKKISSDAFEIEDDGPVWVAAQFWKGN
jgi:ribosomal protein L11 methyltransferase